MTRHTPLTLALALFTLVACSPPIEAPEDLGELTLYMYSNFEVGDGAELAAAAINLEQYMETIDLAADSKDRSVTLPVLTEADRGGVPAPDGVDPEDQIPVAVTGRSENDLDTALELIAEPNQVCIANNGYVYYMRDWDGEIGAYVDGTAEYSSNVSEIRYESLIANVWFDEYQDFRRVDLDDGRTLVIERSYTDQSFGSDNGSSSWDQRFALNVWLPDGDGNTWRFLAFWSGVTIPGLSDDAVANLAVDGIDEGFVNEDAYVAGEDCSNDRDRVNDRP
jgi:hypothetical protein